MSDAQLYTIACTMLDDVASAGLRHVLDQYSQLRAVHGHDFDEAVRLAVKARYEAAYPHLYDPQSRDDFDLELLAQQAAEVFVKADHELAEELNILIRRMMMDLFGQEQQWDSATLATVAPLMLTLGSIIPQPDRPVADDILAAVFAWRMIRFYQISLGWIEQEQAHLVGEEAIRLMSVIGNTNAAAVPLDRCIALMSRYARHLFTHRLSSLVGGMDSLVADSVELSHILLTPSTMLSPSTWREVLDSIYSAHSWFDPLGPLAKFNSSHSTGQLANCLALTLGLMHARLNLGEEPIDGYSSEVLIDMSHPFDVDDWGAQTLSDAILANRSDNSPHISRTLHLAAEYPSNHSFSILAGMLGDLIYAHIGKDASSAELDSLATSFALNASDNQFISTISEQLSNKTSTSMNTVETMRSLVDGYYAGQGLWLELPYPALLALLLNALATLTSSYTQSQIFDLLYARAIQVYDQALSLSG